MLDQSFRADNFYSIFLSENRKGKNIEKKYFKNDIYNKYTREISEINLKLRTPLNKFIQNDIIKKRNPSKETYIRYKKYLRYAKRKLKNEKEGAILDNLNKISKIINNKTFSFNLTTDTFNGKTTYKIGGNPEEFFAIKQLQYNFKKLYKIKQSNRFEIVNQLKNILEDKFPKCIIKTDIKSFFESIPNDRIISQLQKDNLLSPKSKELVKNIIKEFKKTASVNDKKGIPRGIGISAYLAEYYMRKVDEKVKNLPDILYYARYVDDIVIIFIPKSENNFPDYFSMVKEIIENDFSLKINYKKTQIVNQNKNNLTLTTFKSRGSSYQKNTKNSTSSVAINYLGYAFILAKKLQISITKSKIDRYKKNKN
jgi:hypothetical protein